MISPRPGIACPSLVASTLLSAPELLRGPPEISFVQKNRTRNGHKSYFMGANQARLPVSVFARLKPSVMVKVLVVQQQQLMKVLPSSLPNAFWFLRTNFGGSRIVPPPRDGCGPLSIAQPAKLAQNNHHHRHIALGESTKNGAQAMLKPINNYHSFHNLRIFSQIPRSSWSVSLGFFLSPP